ncbi:unnamed protein product, partial [Pneumocystis jirovecii]
IEARTCGSLSIDEVIRVVDNAIRIGLEAEPLPNILNSLSDYMNSPLQKVPTQPPAYAPPSPPLSAQHSASTSISSVPSENPSFGSSSSMTLPDVVNHWLTSEKAYVIELSVFQELLLRGALVTQMSESSLETISRCISIFITASSSIINTFEMHIPSHLLHKTLMNTVPIFTDTILTSFDSYISVYTLSLDDQHLSPENHKWLKVALYNCGVFQSTSTKKSQWLLSSPLHQIKVYTRIFRKFLRILAGNDDKLSEYFSYAHQCFHLLLSKARGHIKMIREEMGQISSNSGNIEMLHGLTDSIRDIEKNVNCSRMRDLFTFQPKEYVMDLQPYQLPFIRSVIARSNFFFKMVHSITGESIQKQIELVLLTDVILFLDIETPGTKFLMFQPFLTRIFKVIDTDKEQTFVLSFYEREHIYLTAATRKTKKLWFNMLSSSHAVQSVNYSAFKLSVNNPIVPKNARNSTVLDEMQNRLSSESTSFRKIHLQPRLKHQSPQDKSHTKLPKVLENNASAIKVMEQENNNPNGKNNQSMHINQSHLSTSHILTAYQNKPEPIFSKSTEYIQKTTPKLIFNQPGLNIHSFPQPPDRTSSGLFPLYDKNNRSSNYSYVMPRMSKIRLETLPEENESFIDGSKSPNIDNSNYKQINSSKNTPPSKTLDANSTSENASSHSVNKDSSGLSSKFYDLNVDLEENESQEFSSSQNSMTQSSISDSNTSVFSKSASQDSDKDKSESDTTEFIEDQTLLSDKSISISRALTPKLPMPDLGRTSLISMIFNDSILGLSYSNPNIAKTSEGLPDKNNPGHTEILFRNSKLIDQLPPSFSSDNSEILFCEKAVTFFWNFTFWRSVFDPEEKVFLIIKYTCKTDMFTLEICNLSSQEVVVCGELQRYSTIVRQAKQEISIACFIQDRVSYILSQFENDSDADLFYIILYRVINRDNPWILHVFQNPTPTNHEYNGINYPLNSTPNPASTPTESPKILDKKTGSILGKSK